MEQHNRNIDPAVIERDKWIYRLMILILGLVAVGSLTAQVILALYTDNKVGEGLVALGSAAVGALAGLFAPSPKSS